MYLTKIFLNLQNIRCKSSLKLFILSVNYSNNIYWIIINRFIHQVLNFTHFFNPLSLLLSFTLTQLDPE